MIRTLSLIPLLATGCIIYEEDWDDGHCHRCGPDDDGGTTVVDPGGDGDGDGNGQTPTEPEPEPETPIVTSSWIWPSASRASAPRTAPRST